MNMDGKMPARIQFGPRNFIDVTDPAEIAALEETVSIHLRHPKMPGNSYALFYPFGPENIDQARIKIESFLLGRRHALGQDLGKQHSGLHTYQDRIREWANKRIVIENGKVMKCNLVSQKGAQTVHDALQARHLGQAVTEVELEEALHVMAYRGN